MKGDVERVLVDGYPYLKGNPSFNKVGIGSLLIGGRIKGIL